MDRTHLPLIAAAAALTYGTRIAGLLLGDRAVPAALRGYLAYVPIAAFAALTAPGLAGSEGDLAPRSIAAAVAAIVALRYRRLWACLAVGMVAYWIARWA
jgi:branched-subunit amino acid transport protein